MKKLTCILLTLTLLLTLAACRRNGENDPQTDPDLSQPPVEEEDSYTLQELTGRNTTADDDGNILSRYSYKLYVMEVPENASQEAVSKAETFNARMEELAKSLEQSGDLLEESARLAKETGQIEANYSEESEASVTIMGEVICLKVEGYSFLGGAHPNSWSVSYLFDWERGVYIDPIEVADDPELLRATVTDQILDQIMGLDREIRESYFTGYEETVARWNEYCVIFNPEGLEVTFSTYELGPHAMGAQVFTLTYEELGSALGEMGRERLGLTDAGEGQ